MRKVGDRLYRGLAIVALLGGLGFSVTSIAGAQDTKAPTIPTVVGAATSSFEVTGAVKKPDKWTVERLNREFAAQIQSVDFVLKGKKGKARCVPLLAVLQAAELRLNPKLKHHELAFTVLIKGKDGYAVSFSWGELQSDIGKRAVWIALDRDGVPLSEKDGPAEIIVPDDGKPSRWVHSLATILVTDGAK